MTARLEFAHSLRGLAAVAVLIAHFIGTFFHLHDNIAQFYLGVEPLPSNLIPWRFDLTFMGQFGVGIFFIISGFVIPFSVENSSRTEFLLRRAFRIYPTYIACVSLVAISIVTLTSFVGGTPPFSLSSVFAHFLILGRGFFVHRFDGVSWTLEIEIAFYLIVLIFGVSRASKTPMRILMTVLIVATASVLFTNSFVGLQFWSSLLLVQGLSYYQFYKKALNVTQFYAVTGFIIITMNLLFLYGIYVTTAQWLIGYILAQIVFGAVYFFRRHVREVRFISHMSDLSYPLYCVHALFGYAIIYVLMYCGFSAISGVIAAATASYCTALLIHLAIERPSIQFSKLLSLRNRELLPGRTEWG